MKCYFCGIEDTDIFYSCYIEKYNKDRSASDDLKVSFLVSKYQNEAKHSVMCKPCFKKNVGDVMIKVVDTIEDLDKDKISLKIKDGSQ